MITIIVATNKRANLLREALFSILIQTYSDFECIVVDDAIDDATKEVLLFFNQMDIRFIYLERPESFAQGLSGCRNFALSQARGEFVHFVDDDDILHPDFLLKKAEAAKLLNQTDYVISPLLNFTQNVPENSACNETASIQTVDWTNYIMGKTGIFSCSVLWHRRCFQTHLFDEDLKVSEDWDLYRKLFKEFKNGVFLDCPLYFRRVHQESNSGKLRSKNATYTKTFAVVRAKAFKEILVDDELTKELAIFFFDFASKYQMKEIVEEIKNWNKQSKVFGFTEFAQMKFRYFFKNLRTN